MVRTGSNRHDATNPCVGGQLGRRRCTITDLALGIGTPRRCHAIRLKSDTMAVATFDGDHVVHGCCWQDFWRWLTD